MRVKLHPGSKQEKILRVSDDFFEVWVKERPIDNKANLSLEKLLKSYFGKEVKIFKGFKSKNKLVKFI